MEFMAVWGVDQGTVQEELLSPLGLVCHGGRSSDRGLTYIIYSKNNDGFKVEITQKELKDISKMYHSYSRKEKLEQIKKRYG